MKATDGRVECSDCGGLIEVDLDPPDGRAPCPNCGSIKRAIAASIGAMQPTNYLLDNFVAHKLSALTACGAPELSSDTTWLNAFILSTVFGVSLPSKARPYLFNFIRRAEGALSAYREARSALLEYVNTPRNVLSPYFRALANFEVCISQCSQGYELLARAAGRPLYDKHDGSSAERLQILYVDSKHMDRMIDGRKIPAEATSAIWITNDGLESSRAALSFAELTVLLLQMSGVAERLCGLNKDDQPTLSDAAKHSAGTDRHERDDG